ncbi:hypothetical protein [Streptomyces sp. AV19]|uniref:hypothetical protein n=2 Tax=Streptomyces sp. AV19 TaxID=2793068 RepID=UPI002413B1F8|nr:hypothetical protein [Streptomyces sp. AV19]MDG4535314.1 hypothetical protein [Streptomyces sp. AV19]
MVNPDDITLADVEEQYERSRPTVKRWATHPDWPEPTGKRGRWNTYPASAVAAWVEEHVKYPTVQLDPKGWFTAQDIEDANVGVKAGSIRSDLSRGRWPEPDAQTREGAGLWKGQTVKDVLEKRRRYPTR